MHKIIMIILIPFLLTACFHERNVCYSEIDPAVKLLNYRPSDNNNTASLSQIDINNNTIYNYEFKNITNFEDESYTWVHFNENIGLTPNNIYKFQYNNDVYFIYSIVLANNSRHQYCHPDTTYRVNNCGSSGYRINADPTCAIPADQADEYFETHIKPKLK